MNTVASGGTPPSFPSLPSVKSTQKKLVLNDAPSLVLLTIDAARALLPGHDEDDILSLVEDRFVPFAWDISLRPGTTARELRLFPACIEHYARTGGSRPFSFDGLTLPQISESTNRRAFRQALQESDFMFGQLTQRVLAALLQGHTKPFISGNTLRLLLNCGSTHLTNLIDAGALRQLPGTEYRRGPHGAALLDRDSVLQFLQSRLEGASL